MDALGTLFRETWGPRSIHIISVVHGKQLNNMRLYFTKKKYNELAYTSHPYSEALTMRPSVSYILYTTSSHEQTGNIITFEKFEEVDLVENRRSAEKDKSNRLQLTSHLQTMNQMADI